MRTIRGILVAIVTLLTLSALVSTPPTEAMTPDRTTTS